jgi:hypothetical protein
MGDETDSEPRTGLRPRDVGAVLVFYVVGYPFFIYTPGPDSLAIKFVKVLLLSGFGVSVGYLLFRWRTSLGSICWRRWVASSTAVLGLGLSVSSGLTQSLPAFLPTPGFDPWRHIRIYFSSHPGPFGFDVPSLVLGAGSAYFNAQPVALPHLVGGVLLAAVGLAADRHLRLQAND